MSAINETREDCTYTQHSEFVLTLLEQGKPKRKKKKRKSKHHQKESYNPLHSNRILIIYCSSSLKMENSQENSRMWESVVCTHYFVIYFNYY